MSFELNKQFYELKLWNKEQLGQLVGADVITKDQFKKITGEDYGVAPVANSVV